MNQSPEVAAYHEAGHAVVAMTLGMNVLGGTIVPEGNHGGHVAWQGPLDVPDKDCLCVYLAGPVADAQARGRACRLSDYRSDDPESDYQRAYSLARAVVKKNDARAVMRLLIEEQQRAEAILRAQPDQLNAVADALRESIT